MKSLLNLALATALAAPLLWPQASSAGPHPHVAPLDCRTLAARVGDGNVWQAHFTGVRRAVGHFQFYARTFTVGCFRTEFACADWVFWQQRNWPYRNAGGCRRGTP